MQRWLGFCVNMLQHEDCKIAIVQFVKNEECMSKPNSFDQVSVEKVANVYYDGRIFSRTLWFNDGHHKILGIVLPVDDVVTEYRFETSSSSERIDILMGECEVLLQGETEYAFYRAGQGFYVEGNRHYWMKNTTIVQYVSNFEG